MWTLYQQLPDGNVGVVKSPFLFHLSSSQVYLVTGGFNENRNAISSTEIFKLGDESWTQVGNLPLPAAGIRGASINNKIIMTGDFETYETELILNLVNLIKWTGGTYMDSQDKNHYSDHILKFVPITKTWEIVDHMKMKKYSHAVSSVQISDIIDYCI